MLIIIAILLGIIASTLLFGAHFTLIVLGTLGVLAACSALFRFIQRVGLVRIAGLAMYLVLLGSVIAAFVTV